VLRNICATFVINISKGETIMKEVVKQLAITAAIAAGSYAVGYAVGRIIVAVVKK
jgi:hypothetical protein